MKISKLNCNFYNLNRGFFPFQKSNHIVFQFNKKVIIKFSVSV